MTFELNFSKPKNKTIKIILWICCTFSSLFANSQQQILNQGELPSDKIYQILQDKKGFVWIATDKGLIKYDGNKCRIFTTNDGLPANDLWEIHVTENNRLWYYCKSRTLGYIQNDSVYNFNHELKNKDFNNPYKIIHKNQIKYFDTDFNLCEIKNKQWTIIQKGGKTNKFNDSFGINEYGIKSIIQSDSTLVINHKNYSINSIIPLDLIKKKFFSFTITPNKKINFKIMTRKGNAFFVIYDIDKKAFNKINLNSYDVKVDTRCRLQLVNNIYQISGPNFYCELDDQYDVVNFKRINPNFKTHISFKDKDNNLWSGSLTKGLYFTPYEKRNCKNLFSNSVINNLNIFNNKIYFVIDFHTVSNVHNMLSSNIHSYTSQSILNLKPFMGDLYIAKNIGIDKITQNHSVKKISNIVTTKKFVSLNKKVMLIKSRGFGILDHNLVKNVVFNPITDTSLNKNMFLSFGINDALQFGDSIFMVANNGFYYLDTMHVKHHPINFKFPAKCLQEFKGSIIIGTDGKGIYSYKNGRLISSSLKNEIVEKITNYKDSLLVASTNRGVYIMNIQKNKLAILHNYSTNDGLPSDFVLDALINENRLYIGTTKGMSIIKLHNASFKPASPIIVNSIKWNGKKVVGKLNYLNRPRNKLEVNFTSIDFGNKNYNVYSYRLLPNQIDYEVVPNGQLSIRNLPKGENTLVLKIQTRHGKIAYKKIKITIRPQLYQNWWFFPFISALVLLIFTLIYIRSNKIRNKDHLEKVRKARELANFKLEALRSQMNPHFVFNSLNAIQYFINESKLEESEKYLIKFSRLIRQFFDLSSEKTISLEKEKELLKTYLTLEKMRFDPDLDYSIQVDDQLNLKTTEIPTMIVQPIVENSVNHGLFHKDGKGKIELKFYYVNENTYAIIIKDDGIGIKNAKKINEKSLKDHTSKSSIIFKERIKLLNESKFWKIESSVKDASPDPEYPGTITNIKITKL